MNILKHDCNRNGKNLLFVVDANVNLCVHTMCFYTKIYFFVSFFFCALLFVYSPSYILSMVVVFLFFFSSVKIFYEIQKLYTFEYDIFRFSLFRMRHTHTHMQFSQPLCQTNHTIRICACFISIHMNTNLNM